VGSVVDPFTRANLAPSHLPHLGHGIFRLSHGLGYILMPQPRMYCPMICRSRQIPAETCAVLPLDDSLIIAVSGKDSRFDLLRVSEEVSELIHSMTHVDQCPVAIESSST
jgi:hypothetical protein